MCRCPRRGVPQSMLRRGADRGVIPLGGRPLPGRGEGEGSPAEGAGTAIGGVMNLSGVLMMLCCARLWE